MSLYELVDSRGALPLLLFLNVHGPSTIYQIVRGLKFGRDAMERAIRVTASLGLCQEERANRFPFSRVVSLTPRGAQFLQTPLAEFPAFLWSGPAASLSNGRPPARKAAFGSMNGR